MIGSSPNAQWRLVDAQGSVKPMHCEVMMVDGAYCLKDSCGSTYVNGADMPLGVGQMARLTHKDEVSVGPTVCECCLVTPSKWKNNMDL